MLYIYCVNKTLAFMLKDNTENKNKTVILRYIKEKEIE